MLSRIWKAVSDVAIEITCLYDESGNMVFVDAKAEKRIKEMIKKGLSIENDPDVILIEDW
jgi:hypothetical protein